jgi:two-component system nitrogen regulation sensor histidine kinase GlnL
MSSDHDPAERTFQRILDAVLDGVIVLSPAGLIERINEEACRVLETSPETATGKPLGDLAGATHPMVELARQVEKLRRPVAEDDVQLTRRFGSDAEVDLAVSPIPDEPGETAGGVVVVIRDRTIGNTLRREATQREQLASYGQIAAGIAHEVKNPLSGIRGSAELLELRAEDEKTRRTARVIVREVERITGLVDELMVFARGETLRLAPVNLHRLIDEVLEIVAAEPAAANVAFERAFDPSIPELVADAGRLTQVFLNLARNAVQALEPRGGRLEITTRMLLAHRLVGPDGRPAPTVEIVFGDDGPGISADVLDRLATPFFTTKPDGTGLGLAVSRHWVARHGGRLRIESEPGAGVRVHITLPLQADRFLPERDFVTAGPDDEAPDPRAPRGPAPRAQESRP